MNEQSIYAAALEFTEAADQALKTFESRYDKLIKAGFSYEAIEATEHMFALYRMYGRENVIIHGINPKTKRLIYDVK